MKTNNKLKNANGLHILGKIFTKDQVKLKSCMETKNEISHILKKISLSELGNFYYQFSEGGFTAIVSLVESHIALHTWPEFGYLTLDVYLCNYSEDNTQKCKDVFKEVGDFFMPTKVIKKFIKR